MNAHFQRIDALLKKVLTLPADQRLAFLDDATGGESTLFDAVKKLLDAEAEAQKAIGESVEGFVEPLLPGFGQVLEDALVDRELEGTHVGPYRIIKEIGRGGMGVVYLAERADGQFEQKVALKLVKRGLDTDEILRRFRRERQILASMHHPNIARLYDGGVNEDGRPYLVTECIAGTPIDDYCDAHRLSLHERLNLFIAVCKAVQYAHQNLVVHRDLKPSNIMVSADGQVKLLDFGIAKLLRAGAASIAPATQTKWRMMTPAYAAPEQVRADAITTTTDIYTLGVVLYELLVGRRPYHVHERQIEEAILHTEPERPSLAVTKPGTQTQSDGQKDAITAETLSSHRGVTPHRLKKLLQGDLDTILLKTLRKEPERRYASAEALIQDLQRFLAGLPVLAQSDTIRYRAGKFVRRHRTAVAAACFIVLALAGGLSIALWQAEKTRRERDTAQAVSSFLEDLFNASDPFLAAETERADTLSIRAFLDRGADRIQQELEDEPIVQAHMLHVLGRVYRNLGLYDQAEILTRNALTARQSLPSTKSSELAGSLQALAGILHDRGEYEAAEPLMREALSIWQKAGHPLEIASSLNDLGALLRDKSAFEEAELLHLEALSTLRQSSGDQRIALAETLLQLGRLSQDRADLDAASRYLEEALALHREALENNDLRLVQSIENMADLLKEKGDLAAAEPLLREALAVRQDKLGETHPLTASSLYTLAGLMREQEKYEEAVALFQQVVELDKMNLGEAHHYVGLDYLELGVTFGRMDAYKEAEQAYLQGLHIMREALPEGHPHISHALSGLGYTYIKMDEASRGETLLREALEIRLEKMGVDSWRVGVSKSALGESLMRQGRYTEAESMLLEGYETLKAQNGPLRAALERLVTFYRETGRPEEAAKYGARLTEATR